MVERSEEVKRPGLREEIETMRASGRDRGVFLLFFFAVHPKEIQLSFNGVLMFNLVLNCVFFDLRLFWKNKIGRKLDPEGGGVKLRGKI